MEDRSMWVEVVIEKDLWDSFVKNPKIRITGWNCWIRRRSTFRQSTLRAVGESSLGRALTPGSSRTLRWFSSAARRQQFSAERDWSHLLGSLLPNTASESEWSDSSQIFHFNRILIISARCPSSSALAQPIVTLTSRSLMRRHWLVIRMSTLRSSNCWQPSKPPALCSQLRSRATRNARKHSLTKWRRSAGWESRIRRHMRSPTTSSTPIWRSWRKQTAGRTSATSTRGFCAPSRRFLTLQHVQVSWTSFNEKMEKKILRKLSEVEKSLFGRWRIFRGKICFKRWRRSKRRKKKKVSYEENFLFELKKIFF